MKISILHPTRGSRFEIAIATLENWLVKCYDTSRIEYILSVDKNDPFSWPGGITFNKKPIITLYSDNNSAIEAINNAAKVATGDLLIVVSDDFDCPEHWDTLLLSALEGKSDFLVKTQDGIQKTLITLPIMDRIYYERFGYVYHPDYKHMHCDEEMTIVGHMLGRVIELPLLFRHNHYTVGGMPMDAINIKNNATWAHGQATLDRRVANNFGIKNPLVKRKDIIWK